MAFPVAIEKGWPVAVSVVFAAISWGSLKSDVTDLKIKSVDLQHDHDALLRMEQRQEDMLVDLADIKSTLHKIEQR